MSATNLTAPTTVNPANDIWHWHEAQIRDLYLTKKKTLKGVKEEMEKNGFPKKPLSTWESKLRDHLKIRKKNKAADWPLVYRHLAPRLETPGKKRLRRPTTIWLEGKEIPFDEAWKEIRRSGAHTRHPLPTGDLPRGIEVRTPSPTLSPPFITRNSTVSVSSVVPTNPGFTEALQRYTPQTAIIGGPPSITSTVSIFSSDLPTTPWISLCVNLRHLFHGGIPAQLLDAWRSLEWWNIVPVGRSLRAQEVEYFQSRLEVLPAKLPRLPRPSHDLGYRLVTSQGNISLSDFVSTSIYLLSNQLHDPKDGDKGLQLLCLLFEHNVHHFTQILRCELSTGRATWDSLFTYSQAHHHKLMFGLLLNIGIQHEWLDPSDAVILVSALEMDCSTKIVMDILEYLCRSDHNHWWRDILDAILIAYAKGNIGIADILVQRFDINAESPWKPSSPGAHRTTDPSRPLSVFLAFVLEFDSGNDAHWQVLDFFLSSGADVDRLLPAGWYTRKSNRRWYNKNEINRALRPTVLDHSFRLDRALFERLSQHSQTPTSSLTKSGILISLEKGPDALRDYLRSRVPATHLFDCDIMRSPLEFLLGEQFRPDRSKIFFPKRNFVAASHVRGPDLKVALSLIQYGIDLNRHSVFLPDIHDLLHVVLRQLRDQITDHGLQLLSILMRKGADIREEHLDDAVQRHGTKFLTWLRPRVKNFPAKAAGALAKAALLDNYEAVEFLLESGANPNAFIDITTRDMSCPRHFFVKGINFRALETSYSVQAIAAGVGKYLFPEYSSLRMTQLLAERGASLVISPSDSTPFAFMMHLLRNGWGDPEFFAKIKFVLTTLKQSKHWTNPPAFLLEVCVETRTSHGKLDDVTERLRIFEYLLSEGADVNPGSPLAALVRAGAPKELVERVLDLGANLDAYTAVHYLHNEHPTQTPLQAAASKGNEELVYLFLEQGANVNSPARGYFGRTALQAICDFDPATEKQHRRNVSICELLMNSGADINAAPAKLGGTTALQGAVRLGDFELTATLIRHGAHVNAPPTKSDSHSWRALDIAAHYGRLDIAKLLLNANALSNHRGITGYDGAIEIAETAGHHAVTGLIHEFLENVTEQGLNSTLDFVKAADDYHIYGYNTDDESSCDEFLRQTEYHSDSSSEYDSECGSSHLAPNGPGNSQSFSDSRVVRSPVTDDFVGYSGVGIDLVEDFVQMEWENERLPYSSWGPLTEILDAQAFPNLQVAANAPENGRISNPSTGFVLPNHVPTQWEYPFMPHNPFETSGGMPDDSALWQHLFEMQDLELGFATCGAGLLMASSDQLGNPDNEEEDAAESNYFQRDWTQSQ